jgi:hypothetical protein
MNAGLTAVSWLDWKLGARLLLKYPALTIFSVAGAIALGAVGMEVAGELLYKRLPFPEGGRVVRLETQDTAASRVEPRVLHDFSIWRRSLKTVVELGAGAGAPDRDNGRWTAISSAFNVSRRSFTALTAQPTTNREYRSRIAARYSVALSPITNLVVSLTHRGFGAAAVKSRANTLAAIGSV